MRASVTMCMGASAWLALLLPVASSLAAESLVSRTVSVTNHRQTPVVRLGFAPDSADKAPANQLKKPLASGKTVSVLVRAPKSACSFAVAGAYADGEEISGAGIDLCNDHVLALVD